MSPFCVPLCIVPLILYCANAFALATEWFSLAFGAEVERFASFGLTTFAKAFGLAVTFALALCVLSCFYHGVMMAHWCLFPG